MRMTKLALSFFFGGIAAGVPLAPGTAHAQAFWTLTLDSPNPTISAGSSGGSVVYTGSIKNTGSAGGPDLNLTGGDFFTTGNWNGTLSLQEDTTYLDFLNNIGVLGPGESYSGALFDVSHTALTPASGGVPYNGTFFVGTDGLPNSLGVPFTLTVNSTVVGGAAAPEPSSLFLIVLASGAIGTSQRVLDRRRTGPAR